MYEGGKNLKEIGNELTICPNRFSKWLKEQGVEVKRFGGKPNKRITFFEKIDTEEKAYWLGFLYADGCVCESKKNGKVSSLRLELGLSNEDKKHILKFLNNIDYSKKVETRDVLLNGVKHQTCRVTITDTEMCRDLIKLGCTPRKSLTIKFPTEKQVPIHLQRHFVRGYIDGDGSIGFKNLTYKTTVYKRPFLTILGTKEFIEVLLRVTDWKKNTVQHPSGAYQIEWCGNNVKKYLEWVYGNSTIYLDRKYNKYLEIKQSCRLG